MKKVLQFILSLIAYIFITIPFVKLFENIQRDLFHTANDILFIHSKITNAIIPVGLLLCFGVYWMPFDHLKYKKYLKHLTMIVLFVITLMISFVNIFTYSAVNEQNIIIRKNIMEKTKRYVWTDVNSAEINYSYGKDKHRNKFVIFNYYLKLNDGSKISFRNSEDFRDYDKVMDVTEFLTSKGIKIKKADISYKDFYLIVSNYKDEYGQNTEKMFKDLYHVIE